MSGGRGGQAVRTKFACKHWAGVNAHASTRAMRSHSVQSNLMFHFQAIPAGCQTNNTVGRSQNFVVLQNSLQFSSFCWLDAIVLTLLTFNCLFHFKSLHLCLNDARFDEIHCCHNCRFYFNTIFNEQYILLWRCIE